MPPESCPNCGADVPRNARSCPECGSDENTGWSEESAFNGADEHDFDLDRFIERECGSSSPVPGGIHRFWWGVAIVLVIALSWMFI